LKDRLTPAQIAQRESKHEFRRSVSIEHGKTRWALKLTHDKLVRNTQRFILAHVLEGLVLGYLLYRAF
jgi:hypothetical protein